MIASEQPGTGSRPVRVFVSSTFQDMHAERDHLNRNVWPELRERCLRLGVDFIAIDLRWGVTRDDVERRGAVAVCLAEIARCDYFVGLLGGRYGWVPPPDSVPEAQFLRARSATSDATLLDDRYELDQTLEAPVYRLKGDRALSLAESDALVDAWERSGLADAGRSITELEVRRALQLVSPKRSMFYVRDVVLGEHGARFAGAFQEADERRAERQATLRAHVIGRKGLAARPYRATFEGIRLSSSLLPDQLTDSDRRLLADGVIDPAELGDVGTALQRSVDEFGTAALGGLDEWGERVQEDLWAAIKRDIGAAPKPAGDAGDRADHERFLVERTALFIGRDDLLQCMFAYLDDDDACRQPLVVTGPAGSGKSALLAECARRRRDGAADALVIPHFIGAAPLSTSPVATVRSLCEALRRRPGARRRMTELPHDPAELFATFSKLLAQAAKAAPIVVIIDALDQLDADGDSHELPWLPSVLPNGLKVIVSALAGDALDHLRASVSEDQVLVVGPMRDHDRTRLASELLARRSKRLMPAQLQRLLDPRVRPDAVRPLYITVAVEELSLFGRFEALDARIDAMPASVQELFEQVLTRVELDHGRPATELLLCSLAASRAGLLEAEILDLFERAQPGFARLEWIRLYRSLQSYLRRMDEGSRGGTIGFFHEQLRRAALDRYFGMDGPTVPPSDALIATHQELAAYFEEAGRSAEDPGGWQPGGVRALSELPYHLAHGEQWEQLRNVITEFDFLQAVVGALGPQTLIDHYALALAGGEAAYPGGVVRGLELLQSSIRLSAHAVAEDPRQLAPQLLARLIGSSDPDVQRVSAGAREWRGHAWLRPRNAFLAAGGELQRVLIANAAGEHVDITPEGDRVVACAAGSLGVWDVGSGRLMRTLLEGYTHTFAITPDGSAVIVSRPGGLLWLLDLATGRVIQTFEGHAGKLGCVTFTSDGRHVVSANATIDATQPVELAVTVWDVASGASVRRMRGHSGYAIKDLAVTGDSRTVVSVGDDFTARVWDLESGQLRLTFKHDTLVVPAVAAVSDHTALTAAADGACTLWDLEAGSVLDTFTCPDIRTTRVTPYANAIALAPQGPYALLAMIDDTLRTWSPSERRLGPVLTGHTHDVVDVALSRDGSLAVSASEDGTVRLWNVADSDASDSFASQATAGHRGLINTVAVTPDGARALSASEDHTIIIWDATTGAANMTLPHNESVVEIHVTADGERAVSRSSDRLLRAWRVATGELDGVWAGADRHAEWPNDRRVVLTHKGGRLVYAYTDGLSHGIEMHRIASGRKGWRFEGEWHVNDLAASSDYVLVCTDRGEVLVLCAKTGSQLHRLNARDAHPFRAAVLPGARALVGYSDGMLRFWDLQTGRVLRTIRSGPRAHDANISALAVVEDLDVAVSGDERGVLMVWDLRELAAHARLVGHTDRVWNLAVAPGGRLVASASADQTLRVWDVPAGAQLTALRTDGAVNSCACGPDGLIVAGGNSGQIQVLDLIEP